MKDDKIRIFYKPQMSYEGSGKISYSNSPKKPRLFIERLKERWDYQERFEIVSDWEPLSRMDLMYAHEPEYIEDFFDGKSPLCNSNSIAWSKEFSETVLYTNASLFEAIKHSYLNPNTICCSPTSGFHHAKPMGGAGFCTFSGQVIASRKLWSEFKAVGCYFDLDGHFGNSIEDTRKHKGLKEPLNDCIPKWANINPVGTGRAYLKSLKEGLELFERKAIDGKVDYVVWCHGADSHKDDNLGSQLNTKEWLKCTKMFIETIQNIEFITKKPFPVSYSLFGGYRERYDDVLKLHEQDTEILMDL